MVRSSIAVTAGATALLGLAIAISSLLAALNHPLSAISIERIDALFLALPFVATGVAGLALCQAEALGAWRGRLLVAWAALLLILCVAGPLTGPAGALFSAATGTPASGWGESWEALPLWPGIGLDTVTLGVARIPVVLATLVTLVALARDLLSAARWPRPAALQPRRRGRPHLPHLRPHAHATS